MTSALRAVYSVSDSPFTGVLKNFNTSAKKSGHGGKFQDISGRLLIFQEFQNAQVCNTAIMAEFNVLMVTLLQYYHKDSKNDSTDGENSR